MTQLIHFFTEKLTNIIKTIYNIITTAFFKNMQLIWGKDKPLAVVLSFIAGFNFVIMCFVALLFFIIFHIYKDVQEEKRERYRVWVREIGKQAQKIEEGHTNFYIADVNAAIRYCDKLPEILQIATIKDCQVLRDFKEANPKYNR